MTPHITPALRAEVRRIAYSTWMGKSIGIRKTLDAIADAVCEAALAAAPKQPTVRTAAGDALAEAVEWHLKIGGVFWGGLASAVEAYRAAATEPWGREQVERLVRAAREAVEPLEQELYTGIAGRLEEALCPFATIADQPAPVPQQEAGKSAGVASAAPAAMNVEAVKLPNWADPDAIHIVANLIEAVNDATCVTVDIIDAPRSHWEGQRLVFGTRDMPVLRAALSLPATPPAPGHTDLMVSPESMDAWLKNNEPPPLAHCAAATPPISTR